jgi:DNA polymerase
MGTGAVLYIDFETKSTVDLSEAGIDVYAAHGTSSVICLGYAFNNEKPEIWTPGEPFSKRIASHLEADGKVVAHNAHFELVVWDHLLKSRYGHPALKPEQTYCTMAQCYALGLPGKLEKAAHALGIPYQKDMKGHRVMLQISKPRAYMDNGIPLWWDDWEKFETVLEYCKTDVEVERAIHQRVLELSPSERKIWLLDYKINRKGIKVDASSAKTAISVTELEKKRLDKEMQEVTHGVVGSCSAVVQIKTFVNSLGVQVESVAKDFVNKILEDPSAPELAKKVLLLRQEAGKSSVAKLQSIVNSSGYDHRIRGTLQYHGATTGRWASRRTQLQNLPRPTIPQEEIDSLFSVLENNKKSPEHLVEYISLFHGRPMHIISDCIRGFFCAEREKALFAADFASIEALVLAWLAGEENILDVFRDQGEVYKYTASKIFGVKIEDVTKEQRQIGKVATLALGYHGGVGAFQNMAKVYGVVVSDVRAEEIKFQWREANRNIVNYWNHLNACVIGATLTPGKTTTCGAKGREVSFLKRGSFLFCRLPSGRVIAYPYPTVKPEPTPWGQMKDTFGYMSEESFTHKWEPHTAHGGILAENVTQAVARDVMAHAMTNLDDARFPVVLTVHDEIVCEAGEQRELSDFLEIVNKPPPWSTGLPLSAAGWKGKRYRK